MYSSDDDPDSRLRGHVDDLLLSYAHEHLTTDYIASSENFVQGFFANLQSIPTHEKGQLVLAGDPLETLKQRWNEETLGPYDETLEANVESLTLLKKYLASIKGVPRSMRVWQEDDLAESTLRPFEVVEPLLSRSSKRASNYVGKGLRRIISVKTLPKLLSLRPLDIPIIPEKELPLADVLDMKLNIDEDGRQTMVTLQKSNPFLSRPSVSVSLPSHAADFLRSSSPPYRPMLRIMSPPLFAREKCGKNGPASQSNQFELKVKGIKEVDIPESEVDITEENMAVIDGWTTLSVEVDSSSDESGTPSLSSDKSQTDELDDSLWLSSSSEAVEPLRSAEEMKMDVPLFPRCKRPGAGVKLSDIKKSSFSEFVCSRTFLSKHVQIGAGAISDTNEDSYNTHPSPQPSTLSLSILGQAPSSSGIGMDCNDGQIQRQAKDRRASTPEETDRPRKRIKFADELQEDLNDIEKLVGMPNASTFQDHIMGEQMDENELMFMDVPTLQSPNAYLRKQQQTTPTYASRMSKVAGLKSLNLELGWRPFMYGTCKPTHEELSKVTYPPFSPTRSEPQESMNGILAEAEQVVNNVTLESASTFSTFTSAYTIPRGFNSDIALPYLNTPFGESDNLILSRSDRNAANVVAEAIYPPAHEVKGSFDHSVSNETSDLSFALTPSFGDAIESAQPPLVFEEYDQQAEFPPGRADDAFDNPYGFGLDNTDGLSPHFQGEPRLQYELGPAETMTVNSKALTLSQNAVDQPTGASLMIIHRSHKPEPNSMAASDFSSLSLLSSCSPPLPPLCSPVTARPSNIVDTFQYSMTGKSEAYGQRTANVAELETYAEEQEQPGPCAFQDMTSINRKSLRPGLVDHQVFASSLLSDRPSASSFLYLIGKRQKARSSSPVVPVLETQEAIQRIPSSPMESEPSSLEALFDEIRAFRIPDTPSGSIGAPAQHSYLVSLDVLQHSSLTRMLESSLCATRLVVRDSLSPMIHGSSLVKESKFTLIRLSVIVSPHAAVLLFPLAALSSQLQYTTLLSSLSTYSFTFTNILVILTSFSSSTFTRSASTDYLGGHSLKASAYSPPVIKTLRRIRRHLAIREGTGEKDMNCTVDLAFADDVESVALLVRAFGDASLAKIPFDMNPYLADDEQEGEQDLMALESMNAFCAALILRCCSLDDFLNMAPEDRVAGLSDLIGNERIAKVNAILEGRQEAMRFGTESTDLTASD